MTLSFDRKLALAAAFSALTFGLTLATPAYAQYGFGGGVVAGEQLRHIKDHCDSLVPLGNPAATSTGDSDDSGYPHISLRMCRELGIVN